MYKKISPVGSARRATPEGLQLRGFTIIELLVVIAVIGVLASIIIGSLSGQKARGRDAKRVSDIKTIQLALEVYYADNGFYPLDPYSTYDASNGVTYALDGLEGAYLPKVPKNTLSNGTTNNYIYSAYNAAGGANCVTNPPVRFHLAVVMESNDDTNSVLLEDTDYNPGSASDCGSTGDPFHGNAASCTSMTPAPEDPCYDVTN